MMVEQRSFWNGGTFHRLTLAVLTSVMALVGLSGCARVMTITQGPYINTAMHSDREGSQRTGEPLELTIVCVYPGDLKLDANDRLNASRGITADVWYQNRPLPGDKVDMEEPHNRFRIPKTQVFVRTKDNHYYGTKVGGRLRGALIDKQKTVQMTFKFAGPLHNSKSVIYVFPKFIDKRGQVLPVPPAKFDPPGAYTHELAVKIGVDAGRGSYGQYIDNVTERKMHGQGQSE